MSLLRLPDDRAINTDKIIMVEAVEDGTTQIRLEGTAIIIDLPYNSVIDILQKREGDKTNVSGDAQYIAESIVKNMTRMVP